MFDVHTTSTKVGRRRIKIMFVRAGYDIRLVRILLTFILKGFRHRKIIFEIRLQKDYFLSQILYPTLKIRFQSKDIQSSISYNVWPFFVLSGCEYHIWYSHPLNYAKHKRKRK